MIIPVRPNTTPMATLEAHDRLLQYLFICVARMAPDPAEFIEETRQAFFRTFSRKPMIDPHRLEVADHIDWLMALVDVTFAPDEETRAS